MDRPDSSSDLEMRGPPHPGGLGGPHGGGGGGHHGPGGGHEEQMFERQQRNFYMDLRVIKTEDNYLIYQKALI